MPSNDDLDRLGALARDATTHPLWQPFAIYLELRAQGRRADALRSLDEFLNVAEKWPFSDRLSLLMWLGEENALRPFDNLLIPQPLLLRVVAPTASEYLACDPESAQANFFYAIFVTLMDADANSLEYLRRAVRLDSTHQTARKTFINWVAGHAEYAQHELPWHGYLGVAADDIRDLQDALVMAAGIAHTPTREEFVIELTKLLETAMAWDKFQRTDAIDFARWCADNGTPASLADYM
jgi:hypothetical protein